jgi:hypothetical protein
MKAIEQLKGGRGVLLIEDTPDLIGQPSLRKATFNKDRDTIRLLAYTTKLFIPSSSSKIIVRYDETNQFVHFEFSLPKFFFGNNVCELIPPIQSRHYNRSDVDMYHLCTQYWYNAMKYAFKKIIFELTAGKENVKYWGDVELFRWDIAFNQIFNTKRDALHYLDSVGRVSAPRIRDGNKGKFDNGNVTFLTENYYFKVYHKGTDFARTGAQDIRKTFEDYGGKIERVSKANQDYFTHVVTMQHETYVKGNILPDNSNIELSMRTIPQLQEYADRILRYEFEAKSKFMSYAYNTRLAKIKMPAYRKLQRLVNYVCREENIRLWQWLKDGIYYRSMNGKLSKKKDKLTIFSTEYWLPAQFFDTEIDSRDRFMVTNIQQIQRIEKVIKSHNELDRKYLLKDIQMIKQVHKFFESEKSKEHRFFFDDPVTMESVVYGNEERNEYFPVKNAQLAIMKEDVPHRNYEGPVMHLMEKVPKDQKLSPSLFRCCIEKFNELFKCLQFEKLPELKEFEVMCKEYNKHVASMPAVNGKRKQKVNVRQMKMLFRTFKHDTWDDLRRSGDVSRKTLYNWRKRFTDIFNTNKTINFIGSVDLTNVSRCPETLYSRHYDDFCINNNPLVLFMSNTYQLTLF